ncbi:MAG: efflux transporter outer membrane subunit [Desulfatirhabdiaceae bacterium]|nr:efflux transporter outer membrane subunit [Desulfatirhabdiaceae bacterium]
MRKQIVFSLAALIFMDGCSLAPNYTQPAAPIPAEWPQGPAYKDSRTTAEAQAAWKLSWQAFFTDPKLQQIIETALNNNRDLRLALLNVEKAAALYGIQKAELFPSINAAGAMSSQRIPADLSSSGAARTQDQYSVNLGVASWEIDFFGRIRSLKDSALENYLATDEAKRSAQILLIAATAGAYLNLAADRENLNLAKTTLQAQQDIYRIINRRYQVGLANEVDVNRSQTQVDTARGDIARFTQQIALDENALNLLLGSPAPADLLSASLSDILGPQVFSSGISSEILLNRPDILAAEHRLKGANANIGAARAALFPRIALTTSVGTASSNLSGLFGSGSGTWSFAPQIVTPIFDARLWSAYDAARIESEIALTSYQKAIQVAFREVADGLAVNGTVGEQLSAQQSLVNAVEIIYSRSELRYQKGIDSYLSVLDAQRTLNSARQGLIALRLARLANQVRLFAVLGGGGE